MNIGLSLPRIDWSVEIAVSNPCCLLKKGFIAQLVKLDNEISKRMVQLFDEHKLDY